MRIPSLTASLIAASLLLLGSAPSGADGIDLTMIGGTCTIFQIKDQPVPCSPNAKVLYSHLPNGITLFNIPLPDQRVFGFIGDRDVQPKPEEYTLFLRRIRMSKGADQSTPTEVTGTCKVSITTDGSIMHRILCNATDQSGAKYLLDFRGDGKPVETKHL